MLRIFVRRSSDLSYLEDDLALEIDSARAGPARWSPLGERALVEPREALVARRGDVVGYDLVFAAPRAPSTVLAVGDPAERSALVGAHRRAVTDALNYVEARALVVRRRILGDEDALPGTWEMAVGYTHGINRAGEPHLHDHVVVPSRAEGRSQAVDGRSLFAHAPAADAVYRSTLRYELARRTGRDVWRSPRGVEHVGGIDEGLRAIWPGRGERGEKRHWREGEARRAWARDLVGYEPGPIAPVPRSAGPVLDEHAFAGAFEGLSPITRRDLVRAWANAATRGAPPGSVDAAIDRHYPQLASSRGLDQLTISRNGARQLGVIRERGPRELSPLTQRELDTSREGPGRSRDR